jgi:glycosyltransferase involved in cell wall biosynthesis
MSVVIFEVGIPTMNNQRTIWQTLAAFVNQSILPDRIHIIDASDDWTPHIIKLFQEQIDPPFALEVERQTDSSGVGAARARIYEKFEGDILACFDTNAKPGRRWVEKHIQTHREYSLVGIVSGTRKEGISEIVSNPHDRRFLIQNNCSIKAKALDKVDGWDRNFDRGEDWDLAIRLWRSGLKTYVRSDLRRKGIGSESLNNRLQTRLGRPSSVRFLRKYGVWYAKFHPAHVLGDFASVASILSGILAFLFIGIFGVKSLILFIIPILGTIGYLVIESHVRTTGGFDIEFASQKVPMFFLFGYTAVREIIFGPGGGWNYGGLDCSIR